MEQDCIWLQQFLTNRLEAEEEYKLVLLHNYTHFNTFAITNDCPISCQRNALFGRMSRLPDDVPAQMALNCQVNLSLG